ncbi:mCG146061, partial [Mus musculus]
TWPRQKKSYEYNRKQWPLPHQQSAGIYCTIGNSGFHCQHDAERLTITPSFMWCDSDLWREDDRRTHQAVVEALMLQNQLAAEALDTKPWVKSFSWHCPSLVLRINYCL